MELKGFPIRQDGVIRSFTLQPSCRPHSSVRQEMQGKVHARISARTTSLDWSLGSGQEVRHNRTRVSRIKRWCTLAVMESWFRGNKPYPGMQGQRKSGRMRGKSTNTVNGGVELRNNRHVLSVPSVRWANRILTRQTIRSTSK